MKDNVFQEILKSITSDLIKKCVNTFNTDYDYEKFKTYEHLQTMLYVHLNQINSLRTLEVAINNQELAFSSKICRSTVIDANQKRSSDCFLWILENLLTLLPKKQKKEFSKVVRALDSSPIQFKWIKQRLKIKKFLGKSENAVRIQLITAIIAYILVFLFKNNCIQCWPMYLLIIWIKSNIDKPLDTALRILSLKQKPPQIIKLNETLCQNQHGCPPNAGKTLTGQ